MTETIPGALHHRPNQEPIPVQSFGHLITVVCGGTVDYTAMLHLCAPRAWLQFEAVQKESTDFDKLLLVKKGMNWLDRVVQV